ncbi:hypothetical protein DB88DRAFT_32495 [Papiliotrema laurentii]|uniref:Transcriptional adapter 2 n=1 Tax=Papiliotrema laurentii TaxID=5418 RepID=A0AAD9FWD7_PAPLA|nr:hypothetical protein DB88DRAFT_32495 [Papiliotrema laurentii]
MTVTQRRIRTDPGKPEAPLTAEPGIKYTCDCCGIDITNTVRIKCAAKECEEVDLCPGCFCEGKEVQRHKAWHDYKVVEQHSQPIFTPDWGADEELLLISGLIINGLGNWAEVATHIGTRTKEECQKHYEEVYLGVGQDEEVSGESTEMEVDGVVTKRKREFMPPMDRTFKYDSDEFQAKKKARIEEMRKPHALPTGTTNPLVSAPTNHEVAGFMPGRLEFEHEVDNDAELVVKDFEFGLVYKYGGDEQPEAKVTAPLEEEEEGEDEDEEEATKTNAKVKQEEVRVKEEPSDLPMLAGPSKQSGSVSPTKKETADGKGKEKAEPGPDVEDEDELEVKLALLDIYFSKLDKREEAKDLIFDRGLTEYKKIQANEKKRPKDERELVQRYKVFAKLQTAQDFEVLIEGLIYEHKLRKRIAELQEYRRMGITTAAEAEVYDNAKAARAGYRPLPARDRVAEVLPTGARVNAGQHRFLHGVAGTPPPGVASKGDTREPTPRLPGFGGRKPRELTISSRYVLLRILATPLNLANAASLDLLSTEEQSLCSSLRVLPKPYLTIKEMYIRENERRKGLLKRRDARKMMKIDVNKSGRIFDFLVSSGMLILAYDPTVKPVYPPLKDPNAMFGAPLSVDLVNGQQMVNGHANGHLGSKGVNNGVKDMNGAPAVPMGMPIGVNGH